MAAPRKVLSMAERKLLLEQQTLKLMAANPSKAMATVAEIDDDRVFQSSVGVSFRATILYMKIIGKGSVETPSEFKSARTSVSVDSVKFTLLVDLATPDSVVINEDAKGITWIHPNEALRFEMKYKKPVKDPPAESLAPHLEALEATCFLQHHQIITVSANKLSAQLGVGDVVTVTGLRYSLNWRKAARRPAIFVNVSAINKLQPAANGVPFADFGGNLGSAVAQYFRENNIPILNKTLPENAPEDYSTSMISLITPDDLDTREGSMGYVTHWKFYGKELSEGWFEKDKQGGGKRLTMILNAYGQNKVNGVIQKQKVLYRFTGWDETTLFMGPKSFERTLDLSKGYLEELDLTIIGSFSKKETDLMPVNTQIEAVDEMDTDETVEKWGESYVISQICSNWASLVTQIGIPVEYATIKSLHKDNICKANSKLELPLPDPPGQIIYVSDFNAQGLIGLSEPLDKYPYQFFVVIQKDARDKIVDKLPEEYIDPDIEHWIGKVCHPAKKVPGDVLIPIIRKGNPSMIHLYAVRPLPAMKLISSTLPPHGLKPLPKITNNLPDSLPDPEGEASSKRARVTDAVQSLKDAMTADSVGKGKDYVGLDVAQLVTLSGRSEDEVKGALDSMLQLGEVYCTIDDAHFVLTV